MRIKRDIPPESRERQIHAIEQLLSIHSSIASKIFEINMHLQDVSSLARKYLAYWYLLNTSSVRKFLKETSYIPFWAIVKSSLLDNGILTLVIAFEGNAKPGSCRTLRTLLEENVAEADRIPRINKNAQAGIERLKTWRDKRIAHWDLNDPVNQRAIDPAVVLYFLDCYLREIDHIIMGMNEEDSYAPYSIKEYILDQHNLKNTLKAMGMDYSPELEKSIENDLELLPDSLEPEEQ